MKKILLSLTTVLLTIAVHGQVDYKFETWVNTANGASGVQDPQGWASFNVLTNALVGMQTTVFKETASPYQGGAAAKIVTQVIPSSVPVPGYDTAGILAIGTIDLLSRSIKLGTGFTDRPANVNFITKYQPAGTGDSAYVTVVLSKYNTGTKLRDIVAQGQWSTGDVTTNWTPNTVALTYNPSFNNTLPDTISIVISSSAFKKQNVGSTLYIDDISTSGWVSVNELGGLTSNVSVFPSPARENVSFKSDVSASTLQIIDVAGRLVGSFPMSNNKATVETAKYESGIYIFNVLNNQNQVVGRGKFEVVK